MIEGFIFELREDQSLSLKPGGWAEPVGGFVAPPLTITQNLSWSGCWEIGFRHMFLNIVFNINEAHKQ